MMMFEDVSIDRLIVFIVSLISIPVCRKFKILLKSMSFSSTVRFSLRCALRGAFEILLP